MGALRRDVGELIASYGALDVEDLLDRDLTIDSRNETEVAHSIQANLENTYEGCGFHAACNYVP